MLNWRPSLMKDSRVSGESRAPSSNTSPVLMSLAACATDCAVIMLGVPRWSSLPHLEGQRSLSGGICQPWAAADVMFNASRAADAMAAARVRITGSPDVNCDLSPASGARHSPTGESGTPSPQRGDGGEGEPDSQ